MKVKTRKEARARRHERVRGKISGSGACPRLSVMISNRHVYAQMIDDAAGVTLAAVSTAAGDGGNVTVEVAQEIGRRLGEASKAKGLACFVVDRGGYRYHGRVKAVVDGALETGLTNAKEAK